MGKKRSARGIRGRGGEAVRKLLFLATRDITKNWTMPISNLAAILNQLVIRFEYLLSLLRIPVKSATDSD